MHSRRPSLGDPATRTLPARRKTRTVFGLLAATGTAMGLFIAALGIVPGGLSGRAFAEVIHNGTDTTGKVTMAIDCDIATAGTQEDCTYDPVALPAGFQVDVTLGSETGTNFIVSAFAIYVENPASAKFGHVVVAPDPSGFAGNPDYNGVASGSDPTDTIPPPDVVGSFNCGSPPPGDVSVTAGTNRSRLLCNNGAGNGPTIASGNATHLVLGRVSYSFADTDGVTAGAQPSNAVNGDNVTLTLSDMVVFDESFSEVGSCNPVVSTEGFCGFATIHFVDPNAATATPTPSDTPMPPTATPTPTDTPMPPTATPTSTDTPIPATATPTPTDTPVPPTATPTPTDTPMPPTATPTSTDTPIPATATPTPTDTPMPPTATPTSTDTPIPATATPTPTATLSPTNTAVPTATDTPVPTDTPAPTATNTTVPATDTPEPTSTNTVVPATDTPVPTSTNTVVLATNTPQPTNTAAATKTTTRTPTVTPVPEECLTFDQKLVLVIGILRRYGAHEGQRRYSARYDVNDDGVIDVGDIVKVLQTPSCRRGHGHNNNHDDNHHR